MIGSMLAAVVVMMARELIGSDVVVELVANVASSVQCRLRLVMRALLQMHTPQDQRLRQLQSQAPAAV